MRHFLITDLEGPAGVDSWAQTREGEGPAKTAAMRLLTAEVNAVLEGILAADPGGEVTVWDGHGTGGILAAELDPRARFLARPAPLRESLAAGADALYFVGQHAMAGTPGAPLCHTYSSRTVAEYRLNGRPAGEFACRAALAGELGVPTVFLAGDDRAVAEARALVPSIVGAITKIGRGVEAADHLGHEQSCAVVRAGAEQAAGLARQIAPLRLGPPYTLRVEMLPGHGVDGHVARGAERLSDRAACYRAERMWDLPV